MCVYELERAANLCLAATLSRMIVVPDCVRKPVTGLSLSPSATLLAVAWEGGGSVVVIDVASEAVVLRILAHDGVDVTSFAWGARSGNVLYSGDSAGVVVQSRVAGSSTVSVVARLGAPVVQVSMCASLFCVVSVMVVTVLPLWGDCACQLDHHHGSLLASTTTKLHVVTAGKGGSPIIKQVRAVCRLWCEQELQY